MAAAPATTNASSSATSSEQPIAKSILQELCSRPNKNSGFKQDVSGGPAAPITTDQAMTEQNLPASPAGLKMKIKRSNSTNSSNGKPDQEELVKKGKKRKDLATTSSSSTSSSRSSSPRSTASPISQLPPFLLAAMTGGQGSNAGPRLDALLRQVAANGPPNKKSKLNGDMSNGESEASSPSSVSSSLAGNTSGGNEASTMTEPDSLGPCEPGTAVRLQGIVWQETDKGGLLMLNVAWKGKTYMGTLLDCHIPHEDHKWGPPGDALADKARGKRGRNTRSRTPPVRIPIRKGNKAVNKNNARAKLFSLPVSPLAKENGNKKASGNNTKSADDEAADESDMTKDEDSDENNTNEADSSSPSSRLIECPKPVCAKKFRDLDALKYHLSYAHNDLKKAATIAAERRKKLLAKAIKQKNSSANKKSIVTTGGIVKKEVKVENNNGSSAPQTMIASEAVVKRDATSEVKSEPVLNLKNGTAATTEEERPLDLQKRATTSPAYSDISDEDTPIAPLPLPASLSSSASAHGVVLPPNLPSLNSLTHRPQIMHQQQPQQQQQQLKQPPPAHSNSLKKPDSDSLKRHFMPPGFHPYPGLPGPGLPAHLAAAVASGRYPPGFLPVTSGFMPGSGNLITTAASRPFMPSVSTSASAKLKELQDRVMQNSRPQPNFNLAAAAAVSAANAANAAVAASAMNSYSSLARDLLPPAHFHSLSRMASMNPGLLPGSPNHLQPPSFPPK